MRRVTTTLAMALLFAGCGVFKPPGEPYAIATSTSGRSYCMLGTGNIWAPGYTGWRLDSGEVVVLDVWGNVVDKSLYPCALAEEVAE